jgi:hypothetical protein
MPFVTQLQLPNEINIVGGVILDPIVEEVRNACMEAYDEVQRQPIHPFVPISALFRRPPWAPCCVICYPKI